MAKTPEEQIADLKAKLERREEDNKNLIARISDLEEANKAYAEAEGPLYTLKPLWEKINPETQEVEERSNTSVYDGLDDGFFIYHEAISFRDDNGYSPSAIRDRAKAFIGRALDPIESNDRMGGPTCENLPKFNRDLTLELIVRVLPSPSANAEG